jgi:YHS domain-containing protein
MDDAASSARRLMRVGTWRSGNGSSSVPGAVRFDEDEEDTMAIVTDPVCGMQIEPDDAAGTAEYQGTTYYFCSQACLDAFEADPSAYVT